MTSKEFGGPGNRRVGSPLELRQLRECSAILEYPMLGDQQVEAAVASVRDCVSSHPEQLRIMDDEYIEGRIPVLLKKLTEHPFRRDKNLLPGTSEWRDHLASIMEISGELQAMRAILGGRYFFRQNSSLNN